MPVLLVVLQAAALVAIVALLFRKPAGASAAPDPRVQQISEQLLQVQGKLDALANSLAGQVSELRREQADAAQRSHTAAENAALALRNEVRTTMDGLGRTLTEGLASFRTDNSASSEHLRNVVHTELTGIGERLNTYFGEAAKSGMDQQASLHRTLTDLSTRTQEANDALRQAIQARFADMAEAQGKQGDLLRDRVDTGLKELNKDNAAKLEEMRVTVDEKLNQTLQSRLTESFGQVTTHLGEVQKGLGEMKELATGVSDLKKVFSNVKSRGIVGEFQLGMQLEQMFSPEQYVKNARIKRGTTETVEYALKFPSGDGTVLLPIDAKFPKEDWERLEHAYEHGTPEEIAKAGTNFERTIRAEGKRICEKYIEEPVTLPHAVMFLPTEALYAEVVRRPGLQADVQQNCRVTIAGPSTFMAILTSFQMGFQTIALQKKGNEVWKVLSNVKTEFGKFETLMTKVEDNVGKVQKSLNDIGVRTRAINRNLRGVTELAPGEPDNATLIAFEEIAGVAPRLAAAVEEN